METKYDIIEKDTLLDLKKTIQSYVTAGWIPIGGVSKTIVSFETRANFEISLRAFSPNKFTYTQAILLKSSNRNKI